MSEALDIARRYAGGRNPTQRANACVALGLMTDDASLELLRELSADTERAVRMSAARALRQRSGHGLGGSWSDRMTVASTLRTIAVAQLNARNRFGLFWPAYLLAAFLPVLIWLVIGFVLDPWPAMTADTIDLLLWMLSAGLAMIAVLGGSFSAAPLPRHARITDVLTELRASFVAAVLIGLAAAACAFAVNNDLGLANMFIILCGSAVTVVLIRLQTALVHDLGPAPVAYAVGLALVLATSISLLAAIGWVSGSLSTGPSGVVVMGLPAALALALTYLRADDLDDDVALEDAESASAPPRRASATEVLSKAPIVVIMLLASLPGLGILTFLTQGRSNTIAEMVLPGDAWPDAQERLVSAGQHVPLELQYPSIIQLATERGQLQVESRGASAEATPVVSTYAVGSLVWLPAGTHNWSVINDTNTLAENGGPSFADKMEALSFLVLKSGGLNWISNATPESPRAMQLVPATMRINPGPQWTEDVAAIGAFDKIFKSTALASLSNFALVRSDAALGYDTGSLFYGSGSSWAPAYAWPGRFPTVLPTQNAERPTLNLVDQNYIAENLAVLDAYNRVYSPFVRSPVPTAWSQALALPQPRRDDLLALLQKMPLLGASSGGELVVYMGGDPFAPISVGTVLRPLALPSSTTKWFPLEIIEGMTTPGTVGGRRFVSLLQSHVRVLSMTQEPDALLAQIRGLAGLPDAHLTQPIGDANAVQAALQQPKPVEPPIAGWVNKSSIPETAPPQYAGYFLVIAPRSVFEVGTIVSGTNWDRSENPGFSAVVDGVTEGASEWVDVDDVIYLGQTYDPRWSTLSDLAVAAPIPNSPDALRFARNPAAIRFEDAADGAFFMDVSGSGFGVGSIVQKLGNTARLVFGWGQPIREFPYDLIPLEGPYSEEWEDTAFMLQREYNGVPTYIDVVPEGWTP